MSEAIWHIKMPDEDLVKELECKTGCTKAVAGIMANRGITNHKAAMRFLNPQEEDLYDPFLMKDMKAVCQRIERAIQYKEKITIYGDYDVDGITSTTILIHFLKNHVEQLDYYIPDRTTEGYGVNTNAVTAIKQGGTSLLITVDTGISAVDECAYAKEIGLDVIVTDHHECGDILPQVIGIINPKQADCAYPDKMLAGVGVAFKLICALHTHLGLELNIKEYIDFVALGTVADIVPLNDENRTLVRLGFEAMKETKNIGLGEMLQSVGYDFKQKVDSNVVGFRIAPRINAAGRLGDAKICVTLFTTQDKVKAREIAEELGAKNEIRKGIENKILKEAIDKIESDTEYKKKKVLVVSGQEWADGVIGIVSSRIKDKYYRPNLVCTITDGIVKASARSVDGFDLYEALTYCQDLLIKYGGHAAAAGLSLKEENLSALEERINQYADRYMEHGVLVPHYQADGQLTVQEVSVQFIRDLEVLEPYGPGMLQPVYIVKGKVKESRTVGSDKQTYRIGLVNGSEKLVGVAFKSPHFAEWVHADSQIEMIGALDVNVYLDMENPQMLVKDIRLVPESTMYIDTCYLTMDHLEVIGQFKQAGMVLTKADCVRVYQLLLTLEKQEYNLVPLDKIVTKTDHSTILKLLGCFMVLQEIGVIVFRLESDFVEFKLCKGKKTDLSYSIIYNQLTGLYKNSKKM